MTAKLTEFQAIYRQISQSQKDMETVKKALEGIAGSWNAAGSVPPVGEGWLEAPLFSGSDF